MKIVLMEPLGISLSELQELSAFLEENGHEFIFYTDRETDDEKLLQRVCDADILMLANQPLKREVIAGCPHLKMISVAFTGVDHVALDICREKGILVCNAAGYSTNAVAELAFGLMIAVYRYILPCDGATRASSTKGSMIGRELSGKTLGIIGTGAIGLQVARIGAAFGCNILGYSRTERAEAKGLLTYVSLEELLLNSDIVSLHVPMNSETKELISREKLQLMKKEAILINTARGGVVDSQALAEALANGAISGAGIDVFEMEPPVPEGHPLLTAPNTVLTPHVAFATKEALYQRAVIVFDNLKAYFNKKPQNVVE